MGEYSDFPPKHPKWDQNLQFLPQSETTTIPDRNFYMGVLPRGGLPFKVQCRLLSSAVLLRQFAIVY